MRPDTSPGNLRYFERSRSARGPWQTGVTRTTRLSGRIQQSRNWANFLARASVQPTSHSQTIRLDHPSFLSWRRLFLSRFLLLSIFSFQKAALVCGRRPFWHACPCQKHPWTKITFLREEKTRSGVPGRFLACRRKRYPIRWTSDRTANSGFVSFERICDISRLRCSGVMVSTTYLVGE